MIAPFSSPTSTIQSSMRSERGGYMDQLNNEEALDIIRHFMESQETDEQQAAHRDLSRRGSKGLRGFAPCSTHLRAPHPLTPTHALSLLSLIHI